jgi:uncharacterized membrane protein
MLAAVGVFLAADRIVAIRQSIAMGYLPPADSFEGAFVRRPGLALLHLLPALVFAVLGPLQLWRRIRNHFPAFHRWSGRIYIVAGVIVAYSAVHLALYRSFGGPLETAASIVFSTLLVLALAVAFVHARARRFAQHREWMIRGFVVGIAVVTIRPVAGLAMLVTGQPIPEVLGAAFWISFLLHVFAAEAWIRYTRR